MLKTKLINRLWLQIGKRNYLQYLNHSNHVEEFQLMKLLDYVNDNIDTHFGRSHDFGKIKGYRNFRKQIPITDWNYIMPYVDQLAAGRELVLTEESTIRFEATSGTTTASKLIPYTKSLLNEFQIGINCWMHNLFRKNKAIFDGKAYWSISPATRTHQFTDGGIPIGTADDKSYFSFLERLLIGQLLVVPVHVAKLNANDFYVNTLSHLLSERESLSFFSAWSPAFILALDDFLRKNQEAVLSSSICCNSQIGDIKELKKILNREFKWADLFPQLQLISCWTDAQAKLLKSPLKKIIGNIPIEGKGLLSTECICSIPFYECSAPLLSYTSHFYEFRRADGEILLSHELEQGSSYEIIVTTGGGLYRYATSDLIEVTGFANQIPCFKFLGRTNKQIDLVGEKISEAYVNKVFDEIFENRTDVEWAFLGVEPNKITPYRYVLNIETKEDLSTKTIQQLTEQVDKLLCKNLYYKEAISLQQLGALTYRLLPKDSRQIIRSSLMKQTNSRLSVAKNHVLIDLENYQIIKNLIQYECV